MRVASTVRQRDLTKRYPRHRLKSRVEIPSMMAVVKMMKAWISSDYRRGLAKLKDYAETGRVPSQNDFVGEGDGLSST